MATVNTEQLLQLLVGIARAQQAVVDAVEGQRPGFKMNYFDAGLERAAKLRNVQHVATLEDFPARVLMQCARRGGPDMAQLLRDLEALLSGAPGAPAAVAAVAPLRPAAGQVTAPAAASAGPATARAAGDDNDLDMTRV